MIAAASGSSSRSVSRHTCGRRPRRAYSSSATGGRRRARPDDLEADTLVLLEDLAPADERVEQHVGERPVLEQQRPQVLAVHRDVAHRLCHDAVDEDRLPREQVHLGEEAPRALAGDLVSGPVEDCRLALEDDDERVARVADPEQELSLRGRALLAHAPRGPEVPGREDGAERTVPRERGYRPAAGGKETQREQVRRMATTKQREATKRNVKKARRAATKKRTTREHRGPVGANRARAGRRASGRSRRAH